MCSRSNRTLKANVSGVHLFRGLDCNSWCCDDCAEKRRRQLIARAMDGKPDLFITLTSRVKPGVSPKEAAKGLVVGWRNVRQFIVRRHPNKRYEFLAIFERGKRGFPHLHILARGPYLHQRLLSHLMQKYCDAKIVDIRRIRSVRQAAIYVSKYVAKAPEKFGTCKRYWTSGKYALGAKWCAPISVRYELQNFSFEKAFDNAQELYALVVRTSEKAFVAVPFGFHGVARLE